MKRSLLFIFKFSLCFGVYSQTLTGTKIHDKTRMGVHALTSVISAPSITNPNYKQIGPLWTVGVDVEGYDFDKRGARFLMRTKVAGDLVWAIAQMVKKNSLTSMGGDLTGLFWFNIGKNILVKDKFVAGLGVSWSDYILGIRKYDAQGNSQTNSYTNPTGWWFAGGGNIYMDFLIAKGFTAHFLANYELPIFRMANGVQGYVTTPGYKKPHFVFFNAHIIHDSGINFGVDYTYAMDRGTFKDNVGRLDLYLGYRFLHNK